MPYMKFLSVRSDICRQLPSDSTSRWTPLPLTMQFPLLGLARDFHPLDNAHAERTPRSELRYLRCLHTDKEGRSIVGEMVVNKAIANDVLDILYKLYRAKYPIERMRLIDYWNADDERAMRANNSSCFNFRFISHTHTVSKHGRGMAVDINTLYNPYHKRLRNGKEVIEPATARPYLDRSKKHAYMIQRGDLCYRLFKEKGFRWGGDWKHSKDYQHFEK